MYRNNQYADEVMSDSMSFQSMSSDGLTGTLNISVTQVFLLRRQR